MSDAETPSDPTSAPDSELVAPRPRVKIQVESRDGGTVLIAVSGNEATIGPRTLMQFSGPMLYWNKRQWSEDRGSVKVFTNKSELLVELERAKRALPFQCDTSAIIVEWKTFLA